LYLPNAPCRRGPGLPARSGFVASPGPIGIKRPGNLV
jgi:hypothetical protein